MPCGDLGSLIPRAMIRAPIASCCDSAITWSNVTSFSVRNLSLNGSV